MLSKCVLTLYSGNGRSCEGISRSLIFLLQVKAIASLLICILVPMMVGKSRKLAELVVVILQVAL